MRKYEFNTVNDMADAVIEAFKAVNDPFESPIVVFHNTKAAQWFKAYYLKHCDEVMMNVRFMTLSVFVNGLINPKREHNIIAGSGIRDYIIKALVDNCSYDPKDPAKPENYIFNADGSVNGVNLYEFADKLSSLFMNYEYDCEDMDSWTAGKWEKDVYDEAIRLAAADNRYTTRSLFDAVKGTAEFADLKKTWSDKVLIFDNSYVSNLYNEILDEFGSPNVSVFSIKDSESVYCCEKIFAAPSMLRETEAVHSEICRIVREDPNARFSDIMVYCPNIDDYANSIRQVFKQDDKDFPAIPYRIVGASKDRQDMVRSLKLLFDIANKRFFTGKDFNAFVKNPMIKLIHDVSDDDISAWMGAIDATNTFRNGKETDDWNYIRKRLLLSKLVSDDSDIENVTEIGGKEYLPYQSIDLDFESLNRLIDMINMLCRWSESFADDPGRVMLDKGEIEKKTALLDSMFSKKGEDGEETNYLYKVVLEENERIADLGVSIPADTWLKMLLDAPNRFVSHPSDIFVNGVTFLSLSSDNVLSEPYVFAMGLSSQAFPRVSAKSEIDYSKRHVTSEILDEKTIRRICGGAGKMICSFVDHDLVKDAELYPSAYMPKLSGGNAAVKIPLDETRDYGDLFTKKEFAAKAYYSGLVSGAQNAPGNGTKRVISSPSENLDTVLKISDIKNYLNNTFVYKFDHLLGKSKNDDEVSANQYEPVDADPLNQYGIIKDLICSNASGSDSYKKISLSKVLPEKSIGDIYYKEYEEKALSVRGIIDRGGYTYKTLMPLELNAVRNGVSVKWTLNCSVDMYWKEENGALYYIEPVDGHDKSGDEKFKLKYYFNAYVFSLMDIVQNYKEEEELNVQLNVGAHEAHYSIAPDEAEKLLNTLYNYMTDYSEVRYMDSDLLKDLYEPGLGDIDEDKVPKTISEFIAKIENNESWKYFADRNMINVYEDFGYTDDIKNELKDEARKLLSCIRFR